MQKRFSCLMIVASMLCSVQNSLSDPISLAPRAAIQANYDHLYTAARHKKAADGLRYFAPNFIGEDFVNKPESGTPIDWAAIRLIATEYTESSQSIKGRAIITAFTVNGNEATATVRHHVVMTAIVGYGHHWRGVFDGVTQDTWVRGQQGWLMQSGRGISLRVNRYEN